MKVYIVFLREQTGGNLTYTLSLIDFLANNNFDFKVLISEKNYALVKNIVKRCPETAFVIRRIPSNIFGSIFFERLLIKAIAISDADVVLYPNTLLPFSRVENKINVCVIHDLNFVSFTQGVLKDFYKRQLYKYAALAADLRIHISSFTLSQFELFLTKNSVVRRGTDVVVWNGVSAPDDYNRNISLNEPYMITFAHQPHKNVEESVQIFSKVAEKIKGLKLYVIGGGKYSSSLAERFASDQIVFTGFVEQENLEMLYAGALAVLFLSKYEGFGLPVFEAFQRKVPIIISNQAALVEVGSDKAFIHVSYVETVRHIVKLYADVDYRLGVEDTAANYVVKFTWSKQFEKMMSLISEVKRSIS